jgi:SM-20-related protein
LPMNLYKLLDQGWVVIEEAIPYASELFACAQELAEEYRQAQIGRSDKCRVETSIRNDKIIWLETGFNNVVDQYLQRMDELRVTVNSQYFLGLFDYECHFARFEPGNFYKTHVDAFADQHNPRGNRKLSSVLYLNEDWQPEDGGELVLYAPDTGEELTRVLPQLGTLVLFLSEEFPHEVLPARRVRQSLTGWFRTRPDGV